MAKFKKSRIDFGYKGESYHLDVNARVAVDLEQHIGTHPLNLAININRSQAAGELPPMGKMAEFFEFMLKRAGVQQVDFDEVYGELFSDGYSEEIGLAIGEMLSLFIVSDGEESDPKPRKGRPPKKK